MKQPKSFEEGMDRLIHYCNTALDKARLQIEEIDASLAPDVEVPHDA